MGNFLIYTLLLIMQMSLFSCPRVERPRPPGHPVTAAFLRTVMKEELCMFTILHIPFF